MLSSKDEDREQTSGFSNGKVIDHSFNEAMEEMSQWNEVKSSWRRGIGNNEYNKNLQRVLLPKAEKKMGDAAVMGN